MTDLLLAALIACSTGQATCTAYDVRHYTAVEICDVSPETDAQQRLQVNLNGRWHMITISARCNSA